MLFWGIFGALVLRAIFIFAGVALIERFDWILYVFGAFLLFTAARMVFADNEHVDPANSRFLKLVNRVVPTTDELDGQQLFTRINGKRLATPLFAVLVLVEVTDVIFAVDSVPAVLAVSHEQFIVFSSNAFAILGLRALYFLLADMHARFTYLQQGLAVILAFVGVKMIIAEWYHIPTWLSLLVIALVLTASIGVLAASRQRGLDEQRPDCRTRRRGRAPAAGRRGAAAARRLSADRPMAIADDDIERLRSTVSIVDVVGQFVALRKVGRNWVGLCPFHAEKTPSFNVREETGRYKCFGCDKSRRRVHVRPGARAPRLRRRRRVPRGQGRDPAHLHVDRAVPGAGPAQAAGRGDGRRPSSGTTSACSTTRRRGRPATTCAAAGLRGDVARTFKLGWAPDDWDALAAAVGHRRRAAAGHRAGVHQPAQPAAGRVPGPGAVPDLLRRRRGGGDRRADPARLGRPGEVQELAGDADLRQVEDAVRAELGEGRHRRVRPGRRVRGLHRRDRVPPGRRARGRWRRAARRSPRTTCGCSSATPAGSCWPSTPTPPARARPSGSTSGSRSTRCRCRWPGCPAGRIPGELAQRDPEALAAAVADAAAVPRPSACSG